MKLVIIIIALLCSIKFALGGQNQYDLSQIKSGECMALSYDPKTEATMGICPMKAKDGIVNTSEDGYVLNIGAGIYYGTKDKRWPISNVYFVTDSGDNETREVKEYEDTGIRGICENIHYEGISTGKMYLIIDKDRYPIYGAKPTTGSIEKVKVTGSNKILFPNNLDLTKSQISTDTLGTVKIVIAANITGANFLFILDKDKVRFLTAPSE